MHTSWRSGGACGVVSDGRLVESGGQIVGITSSCGSGGRGKSAWADLAWFGNGNGLLAASTMHTSWRSGGACGVVSDGRLVESGGQIVGITSSCGSGGRGKSAWADLAWFGNGNGLLAASTMYTSWRSGGACGVVSEGIFNADK